MELAPAELPQMPEWLTKSFSVEQELAPEQLILRLLLAACYGGCVALIYVYSHGRNKPDSVTLKTTLVLLSILIAMVSMVIGESVARAFSLVGALSIVRFRTVVEDTRDTAFVIFAVIVGMAAGAGLLLVPVIGIPLVGVVAILLSRLGNKTLSEGGVTSPLSVRLGLGHDPEVALEGVLKRHLESYRLVATGTARQGSALDLSYLVRLRTNTKMTALVTELNQVEGVQNVELRV